MKNLNFIKIITLFMLFLGFPLLLYTFFSFGNGTFNIFLWDKSTPALIFMSIFIISSLIAGLITINSSY